eukprot:73410-Amphidinium_carterae.1
MTFIDDSIGRTAHQAMCAGLNEHDKRTLRTRARQGKNALRHRRWTHNSQHTACSACSRATDVSFAAKPMDNSQLLPKKANRAATSGLPPGRCIVGNIT